MPDDLPTPHAVCPPPPSGAAAEPGLAPALGDGAAEDAGPVDTPPDCEFTCGVAGSGKTWLWRERIKADPAAGLLCATTGIAAVNLGTVTLNSTLGFFDTDSLRDIYLTGQLVRKLKEIRESHRRIVIDEVSMMDGDQLSILVRGLMEANTYRSATNAPPLGISVVGDFCQLPPVRARWAFESDEWHRFEARTTRLTKVWRQDAGPWLDALNMARSGDGARAAEVLTREGLEWHTALDISFDGTTIVSKNDQVDRYNGMALDRLAGSTFTLTNRRWGKARGEWRGIPDRVTLKKGAYVMLLANSYDEDGELEYANGDCGHVTARSVLGLHVQLVRNGAEVLVEPVVRDCGSKDRPTGWQGPSGRGEWLPRAHWMPEKRRFVEGQVEFWPVRLAYASTIHKSQGLSLDRIQFDCRDHFAGQAAMVYVALSRCRTMAGLRLVGQRERFIKQCRIDPKIRPWL